MKNISKESLIEDYIKNGLTLEQISNKYNVARSTICRFINKYNLRNSDLYEIRNKAKRENQIQNNITNIVSKDVLYKMYIIDNLSYKELQSKLNCSQDKVKQILKFYNIKKDDTLKTKNREKTCVEKYNIRNVMMDPKLRSQYKKPNFKNRKKSSSIADMVLNGTYPIKQDDLVNDYLIKNMTKKEISQKYNIPLRRVDKLLQLYNIKKDKVLCTQIVQKVYKKKRDERKLDLEKYLCSLIKKPTIHDLAITFNCSVTTIQNRLREFDLQSKVNLWPLKSHYEKDIQKMLEGWGIKVVHNKRAILSNNLEIDLYCPDYKIGIEFNGDYWHSSAKKDKNYHFDKSRDAQDKNIRLIHIYEYEWMDLQKRSIIISMLKIAFKKIDHKIFARNCEVRKISNKEAKVFNDQNHLQGHRNAQVTLGLYHKNELVQLMSFSKTRYNKNLQLQDSWEIIRGCPGSNNIVVGGVSKLFEHFKREYCPKQVFSYCDFNKFDGRGYETIGMHFVGYTGPDMKWLINGMVVNRQPSKHSELKEKAQAQIWGAGSKKYLWTSDTKTTTTN